MEPVISRVGLMYLYGTISVRAVLARIIESCLKGALSESTRCGGPGGACTCWTHGVSFQVLHVPLTVIILFQCGLMPSNEGFQVEGLSESTRCGGPGGACTCWTHGVSFQVLPVPLTVIILFQCGLTPSNEGFQAEGLSESTRSAGPPQRSKRAHIWPAGLFSRG